VAVSGKRIRVGSGSDATAVQAVTSTNKLQARKKRRSMAGL
jgi:hypothetical protein